MTPRVRRSALRTATLAALLGAVACSGGDVPRDDPEGFPRVTAPPCSEVYAEGRIVREADLYEGCSPSEGVIQAYGIATTTCSDGRTLWWNDMAWGYYGEPLHRHTPGAEQVPPRAERDRCSAP